MKKKIYLRKKFSYHNFCKCIPQLDIQGLEYVPCHLHVSSNICHCSASSQMHIQQYFHIVPKQLQYLCIQYFHRYCFGPPIHGQHQHKLGPHILKKNTPLLNSF